MFFKVDEEYYNLSTVANITYTDHKETRLKKLNLDHAYFAVVRVIFLKEYNIPQLTFYADYFSVSQMMYDFKNHKQKVHEFIVLSIPDMKKINKIAKEREVQLINNEVQND